MSIKIAYSTEEDTSFDSVRHIAEAVTQTGERLRYTHMVPNSTLARHGELIQAHAKRHVLHSLVDDAIHKGLL